MTNSTGANRPVTGWRCRACGRDVDIAEPMMWRCPGATGDDRAHALTMTQTIAPLRSTGDPNPFVGFQRYLAVDAFAEAHGASDDLTVHIRQLSDLIEAVDGRRVATTPFERSDALSEALGFGVDGGVWVKDETGGVAGSHKARHLMSTLLYVLMSERCGVAPWSSTNDRPRLAIASCGNAALAAATLAAAVQWPITVFVPQWANGRVIAALQRLHATIVECPRRASDPPGDPCLHRFREAVAAGAIPFTVQGTENAWCLDGGRTIGWEMARHMEEQIVGPPFDRIFVQVGAGTFAASVMAGFRMSGITPRLHAVQTAACAPLDRAWRAMHANGYTRNPAQHWDELMTPWGDVGSSAADGILDDETYDWLPVVEAMTDGNGSTIVVDEAVVLRANELGRASTGITASHTGTAGLAGLLAVADDVLPDERVAVIFSGVAR